MSGEKLKEVLEQVEFTENLNHNNIIPIMGEILAIEHPNLYKEWKKTKFDVDHLFSSQNERAKEWEEGGFDIDPVFSFRDEENEFGIDPDISPKYEEDELDSDPFSLYQYEYIEELEEEELDTGLPSSLQSGRISNAHTLLHAAASYGLLKSVNSLLAAGANVNIPDGEYSCTALHWAVENGHTEIVKTLLENGAEINSVSTNWNTPLHIAASFCLLDIVKVLLNNGANVNAQNDNKDTPLHCAVRYDHQDIIKILVEACASASLENIDGETPIFLARNAEIKEFLKSAENALNKVKNKKIGASNVSYYELLQASESDLIRYAHDAKLCKELKTDQYKNKDFSIFTAIIDDKYQAIIDRQHLEEKALEPLGKLNVLKDGKQVEIKDVLNQDVLGVILTHLTNVKLEMLIEPSKGQDK